MAEGGAGAAGGGREVQYEEVQRGTRDSATLIVDVREPSELLRTGSIPSSINIPLSSVADTLGASTSQDEFQRRFERSKPSRDAHLIFYCQAGRRAAQALHRALELGYTNSKTYSGSWQDWSSRQPAVTAATADSPS